MKKQRNEEGADWVVSYADVMTLLMCFFVLLVGMSSFEKEKYNAMVRSFESAFGKDKIEEAVFEVKRTELQDAIGNVFEESQFDDLGELIFEEHRVLIRLSSDLSFESGKSDLTLKAIDLLAELNRLLLDRPLKINISGHCDDSNLSENDFVLWKLSSDRALSVAQVFLDGGFKSNRMKLISYADTKPLAPNLDEWGKPIEENRKKNRRVEIYISPL